MIFPDLMHMPMGVILFLFFILTYWATIKWGVWGILAGGFVLWTLMLNNPYG